MLVLVGAMRKSLSALLLAYFQTLQAWKCDYCGAIRLQASTSSLILRAIGRKHITTLTRAVTGIPMAYASFGPDNAFMLKSYERLKSKSDRMISDGTSNAPWAVIDDAVRGTIVVKTAKGFAQAMSNLNVLS